jgi:hypothetical protein
MVVFFAIIAIDRPPKVGDMSALTLKRADMGNNSFTYGKSWLRRNDNGLWEAYIEGKPFERGVAFGQLTKELLYYQETSFFEQIRELVPSDRYLKVLKYFIAFFNRNLDKNITAEYKEEIYGTSFACDPEYDFIGSGYQRQLNYHAAHDIGHALQGLNLVACTSFSVWNSASSDSCLLTGRNFDFYMGDKFAENKIVCFVNPSEGLKFMMITWADLIGVVSGMNEKGFTVTLNAAKSTIPLQAATPVTLLAREILQYASTIEEAFAIAQKRDLFVSESIMISSAIDHKTAIIEKSPDKTGLFLPETDRIICANHFQGTTFADDEINLQNIHGSDSYKRYMRVGEIMDQTKPLNVSDVASILRDQKILGDSDAGMGNQLSINQLIAHHSVIFKPDSLLVWVSASPWQLGEFVVYDLNKIFNLNLNSDIEIEITHRSRNIAPDPFLKTEKYTQFLEFRSMTAQLKKWKKNRALLPQDFISSYIQTNPEFYLTYVHLGDYYVEMKDFTSAHDQYAFALKHKLPGIDETRRIYELEQETLKKIAHGSRNRK